ncbi:MAG: Sapep family Mn(2+)-dependent dipeptidase [Erysipelotrichaceae bacterium]|nr:Sapep family Mn(2+)-dependent dipeptidase [Erysipelotrichaceae bacterium]
MLVKEFIEANFENMKADLKELVSYNSVYSDDEKPFGSTNRKVLDKALQLMEEKGLKTENLDYYCGYGEIGSGDKLIGILAHLDVVPAGEGWNTDPFEMVEKDGFVYGRGVSDDKGGAVASMYALKYLIDEKYPFKKRVRLILGCNEETGSACIAHYVKKKGHIDYGYTPDGNFPGIYAEKGMYMALVAAHGSRIIDIKGGEASNVVCKRVNAVVPEASFDEEKFKSFLDEHNVKYDIIHDGNVKITVYGVAAHASTPDLGVNAISHLLEALYASGFDDSFVKWFHEHFALMVHGELAGFEKIKDSVSNTSINFGVISKEDDEIRMSLDMRFPVMTTSEKVCELMNFADENNELRIRELVEPLYFDINTPMIKALKKAYEDVTGDKQSEMEAIGGGTYAKAIHNCIAFGCEFAGEDNHIHDANESLNLENFKKQIEIYVEAIKNLNEIED